MLISFGIVPSGNECRPVYLTFLNDIFGSFTFDISFSVSFRVSCRFRLRRGSSSFPCSLFAYIVFEAARISQRTVSFRGPLSTISIFCDLWSFLAHRLQNFLLTFLSRRLPLKRPVVNVNTEIIVPYFLLNITAKHFFQSKISDCCSFLDCIVQIQKPWEVSIPWRNGSASCTNFQYIFIGNFCHEEKYFVPLGVDALRVVILQLDPW